MTAAVEVRQCTVNGRVVEYTIEPDAVYIACERKMLAYHEAGHVVAAHLVGYRVSEASVGHSGTLQKFNGYARVHYPAGGPVGIKMFVKAAGPVAQMMFTEYVSREQVLAHAWRPDADFGEEEEAIRRSHPGCPREFINGGLEKVRACLEPHRAKIEAVATTLLERETLGESEISDILAGAHVNGNPR